MTIEKITDNWVGLDYWLVNDRFAIYSDGVVYDTKQARDIPSYIFNLKHKLIEGVL
jgi:hypothetical protein